MKHGLCVRGIAAASLALAATTASAAPPVAAYANAVPNAGSIALTSADPTADRIVTNRAEPTAAPDTPAWFSRPAVPKSAGESKPIPGNSVDQPLNELVEIMRPRFLRARSSGASPAPSISKRAGSR